MKITRKRHIKRHNKTKNKKRHNKTKTRRHKKYRAGGSEGSKIYTHDGKIEKLDEKHEGKDIFRKMTDKTREINISKIIMENPHENIVTIYKIVEPKDALDKNSYIDMEKLNTNISKYNKKEIKEIMENVKNHLQKLGIVYIDWKPDNIGLSEDGKLKLFDFDLSGLINKDTKIWTEKGEPPKFWAYQHALLDKKDKTPLEIDNYAFNEGLQ
jgi:serine/threonine protein kinase